MTVAAPARPAPVYAWTKNRDGTFNIHDVPVMSLLDVGAADQETEIDEAWLRDAVTKARLRETRDHYMAPLHVHHHDDGESVKLIGFLRLKRVGPYEYEGEKTKAVFADLIRIKPEIFAAIRKLELPYRSVEILDARKQEIDSLALLAHHVPFFRYALLRVAETGKALASSDGFALVQRRCGSRIALARRGHRYSLLCSAEGMEVRMKLKDDEKKPDEETKDVIAGGEKPKGDGDAEVEVSIDTDEDEEIKAQDGGDMAGKLDQILALLQKLVGGDAGAGDPGLGGAPAEPETMAAAFAARRTEATRKAKADASKVEGEELVRLRAENAALRMGAKRDTADAKSKAAVEKLVAKARTALAGYELDESDEKDIRSLAAHGEKAIESFVAAIKRRAPEDPAETLDAALADTSASEDADPDDRAFLRDRKIDPKQSANVAKARKDWIALRANGSRAPFESFIEANADLYGIVEPEKSVV